MVILKNLFYYGVMRFKGELYEGSHPPLISKRLFDRVQEVMQIQAKPMKRGEIKFAFTGLMMPCKINKGCIDYTDFKSRLGPSLKRYRKAYPFWITQITDGKFICVIPACGRQVIFNL